MTRKMQSYPNLPLLSLRQCMEVFSAVGLSPTVLASLSGFTRMQVWRWRKNIGNAPHTSTQELVSALAYKVLRAARAGNVPKTTKQKQLTAWSDAISDETYPIPLSAMNPLDLLPKKWVAQFDLQQRHADATEVIS